MKKILLATISLLTMLMCGKVTHKKLIDISPYYSESQVKINRFLKVCMIKYDYKKWTIRICVRILE